ncbi:purine permease, partial [Escherichia coli]|nr:purine permease [Escherichia coli]
VGMGLGVTAVPELFAQMPSSVRILTDNGIVAGSVTAILLNIVFNVAKGKKAVQPASFAEQKAS